MAYVTIDQARRLHLKLSDPGSPDPQAEDLEMKLAQAEAIVLSHLKQEPADSNEEAIVQAAILKVFGSLFRFRGDEEKSEGPLTPDVIAMLSQLRYPSIA